MSPRGLDLLAVLVSQPGTLFTKDELFDRLWTGVTVTENALTQVISELRFVLNETPADPKYIETVTRKGYRFKAQVEPLDADPMPVADAALAVPSQSAQLQSAIATALMAGLRVTITASPQPPLAVRETPSLDAFRLATDGRIKLETLDPAAVKSAVLDFTRALALDPAYGPAHTGLALAHFWLYQASRARSRPDVSALDAAILHAERAAALDPGSAEAQAQLAFFLGITARVAQAREHGRLALSIDPGNWRHQFMVGVAEWGAARLACLDQVMAQYPALTHAHFAAAMVHVARADVEAAGRVLDAGLDRMRTSPGDRFPGRGLHWLRGLVAFRRGDADAAHAAFDAELAAGGQDLFSEEYAVDALSAHGFVYLRSGSASEAASAFERALERFDDHARSWYGLAAARRALGQEAGAGEARARGDHERQHLMAYGREAEGALVGILGCLVDGDINDACGIGNGYLERTSPSVGLATLPVEPWMQRFRGDTRIDALLASIAARANV